MVFQSKQLKQLLCNNIKTLKYCNNVFFLLLLFSVYYCSQIHIQKDRKMVYLTLWQLFNQDIVFIPEHAGQFTRVSIHHVTVQAHATKHRYILESKLEIDQRGGGMSSRYDICKKTFYLHRRPRFSKRLRVLVFRAIYS